MLQRDIGRPTHTGIHSKLMTVGSRGLHHGVGQEIYFFDTHFHTLVPGGGPGGGPGGPRARTSSETGACKKGENRRFSTNQ